MWGFERCSPARFLSRFLAGYLLFACLPVFAQDDVPVFRTGTTLVEFTLIALDRDGNPVTDLTHEEIVIKDQGRPRALAFFRFEGGEESQAVPPLPAGIFSNRADRAPGPPRNITAILLDVLNTPPENQVWVKAQVMRYLRAIPSDTRVAIYVLGQKLAVLHDFTSDWEALRARIESAQLNWESRTTESIELMARDAEALVESLPADVRETFGGIEADRLTIQMAANEQVIAGRMRQTLQALEELSDHLAGIPGRKSLVWISGGISMFTISPRSGPTSYENLVTDTSRRLAQRGITLYMVDAHGLRPYSAPAPLGPQATPRGGGRAGVFDSFGPDAEISNDSLPAMYKMAGITGGRAFWDTNDMAKGIKAVSSDSRATYSLGFYPDLDAGDKWRELKVEVKRKGVRLLHRSGYALETPAEAPLVWNEEQWRAAIYNPIASTGVRLDAMARVGSMEQMGSTAGPSVLATARKAMLMVQIVADDLHFRRAGSRPSADIEFAVVEKQSDGRYRMQKDVMTLVRPLASGAGLPVVSCRHMWDLLPEASTIRIIVRDRFTGRHGALDVPVKEIPAVTAADFGR